MSDKFVQITLFLMTEKGYRILQHIVTCLDKAVIKQVVGAQDKHLTRDYYDEIKWLCEQHEIPFADRLEKPTVVTPYSIAISWRWLIHDAGTLIVLHDSLLPRYRGFAPLVNCLINGESQIGVTALFANAEFDRGDILAQTALPVQYPIKIAQAIELSVECYKDIISLLWPKLQNGLELSASPQLEAAATYSLWRDEEDYHIDWSHDSILIKRFIDALGHPYQGAKTFVNGKLYRLTEVEVEPDVIIENRAPGKVLFVNEGQPVVVCGTGLLRIVDMRTEVGDSALPLKQFRSRFQ